MKMTLFAVATFASLLLEHEAKAYTFSDPIVYQFHGSNCRAQQASDDQLLFRDSIGLKNMTAFGIPIVCPVDRRSTVPGDKSFNRDSETLSVSNLKWVGFAAPGQGNNYWCRLVAYRLVSGGAPSTSFSTTVRAGTEGAYFEKNLDNQLTVGGGNVASLQLYCNLPSDSFFRSYTLTIATGN